VSRTKTRKRTPGLDVEGDNRLGGDLGLVLLLLAVLGQALLADADGLGVLLLVVAAEEVDILVLLLLSGGGLGGVDGDLGDLGAVDGVGLAGIAGQGGELVLVRGDVLVPAGRVGVLGGVGGGAQGLEGDGISLRGRVAVAVIESARHAPANRVIKTARDGCCQRAVQRCTECWVCNQVRVLRPLSNTDHGDHQGRAVDELWRGKTEREGIPSDVGPGQEPVVEH